MGFCMRKLGIIFVLLLAAPLTVVADDAFLYWGVMVGQAQVKGEIPTGESFNYDPTNFTGRLGVELGRILSVEVRAMRSNKDEDAPGEKLEINYLGNAMVKLNIPFGDIKRVNVYGLAGYSAWKLTADSSGDIAHDTYDGASYGVGIDLIGDGVNGLNFEYVRYGDYDENGLSYNLDSASIGYFRRF